MSLKTNEQQAVFDLKKAIEASYKLLDYKLYGSKARGTDSPDSDVDVMIELEDLSPQIELNIANMVFETNIEHSCLVSAVIFGRKELEDGPMNQSPLYRAIQREGVAL